jgi:glycosyltransferase involved in cell wall biosynthesis
MRILQITAGAGGMYCGSCLRDNVLATATLARGHDVALLPVYTPTRTDEPNVSDDHVFLGGISVYLEQHIPFLRKTPAILDWLWDRPAVIRLATGRGVTVEPRHLGELTVSTLRGEEGNQAKELRKLMRYLEAQPPFDVVVIPMSMLLGLAPPLKRTLGRPICCTLQGDDLFLDGLGEPWRSQCLALIRQHAPAVDAFIATSRYYADFMAGYLGLARDRIHHVPLGIHFDGYDPVPRVPRKVPVVGYFARIAPEKGLHQLAEAYRMLRRERGFPAARLEAAGYLAPEHRGYLGGIEANLVEWGLANEFRYRGAPDRAGKIAFLEDVDVFCVPSPYAEPKGLYLLEAMASGAPVVSPRHGAFPEILEKTGGGVLFEPNDTGGLADRLRELLREPKRAAEIGQRGAAGVRRHYSADEMAARQIAVYESVVRADAINSEAEGGLGGPKGPPGLKSEREFISRE